MNKERLEHLIEVLKEVPPNDFDMSLWQCGTQACAMGWACRDPQFRKEGLTTTRGGHSSTPAFEGHQAFYAAAKFFGISRNDAGMLFSPSAYDFDNPTVSQVIGRIRDFIDGKPLFEGENDE